MRVTKHSLRENKKQTLETIKLVEDRMTNVKNKINIIKNETTRLKSEIIGIKPTDLNIIELENNIDVLNDGENELINILNIKNDELNNINQRIRDIERFGETNPFDFRDVPQDIEIDVNKFLTLAEKNVILFENNSLLEVVNNVIRDKHPFILKGEIRINDNDPASINKFCKDTEALSKWIEKIKDNYDETLNISFTGELI